MAHSGPANYVPAHGARNDPPGGVASRTSTLPSCADTPRIRRDEGHKPTGRGGLGQGGRQPIRPGNRGVLPLATVIASVNCPRCLAEQVTKHPPARNHPTCDCCHDPLHRAAPAAVAMPTGGLVVRADSRTCARAEMRAPLARISMHRVEYSLGICRPPVSAAIAVLLLFVRTISMVADLTAPADFADGNNGACLGPGFASVRGGVAEGPGGQFSPIGQLELG